MAVSLLYKALATQSLFHGDVFHYSIYQGFAVVYATSAAKYFQQSSRYHQKFLCCMHWMPGTFEGVACGCDANAISGGIQLGLSGYETFGFQLTRYNKPGDRIIANCAAVGDQCVFACQPSTGHPTTHWKEIERCEGDWMQCNTQTLAAGTCECSENPEAPELLSCPVDFSPIWAQCG